MNSLERTENLNDGLNDRTVEEKRNEKYLVSGLGKERDLTKVTETTTHHPYGLSLLNPYGTSHLCGESLLNPYWAFHLCGLSLLNPYGTFRLRGQSLLHPYGTFHLSGPSLLNPYWTSHLSGLLLLNPYGTFCPRVLSLLNRILYSQRCTSSDHPPSIHYHNIFDVRKNVR